MSVRSLIRSREKLIGTLVTIPSPEIVEILMDCGVDWLFLDLEHSAFSTRDAQKMLQVVSGKTPCLVRTESKDETAIRKALDIGAQGIIVPQVNSAAEAAQVVTFAKYPPGGARSVGLGRAQGYGLKFKDYIENANESLAIVVQIEHIDAVRNLQGILDVPGIDAVFIGPYDLSGSLGKLGQLRDPEVQQAIETVFTLAKNCGMPVGAFAATTDAASDFIAKGVSLLAFATEALLLGTAVKRELGLLKKIIGRSQSDTIT